jgi:hypothetical protein
MLKGKLMSNKVTDDSESVRFKLIKNEYLNSKRLTLESLAEKHNVDVKELRSVSRSEKWSQERGSKRKQEIEKPNSKKPVNGDSIAVESESTPVSNSNSSEKGGNSFSHSQSERTIESEMESLRSNAFELASSAAESLNSKEDWNPKEFDLLVGTFAKIVGVQMKMEGNEDGIDRLFSELTDTEVFRTPSAKSEEGADES